MSQAQFLCHGAPGREGGVCSAYIQVTGKSPWLGQKEHVDITRHHTHSLSPLPPRLCFSSLPRFLSKLPILIAHVT